MLADQQVIDIPEIQTNVLTEISKDKCLQAWNVLQKPLIVDDSGIYFSAFNEFPGALSKFLYTGIGLAWMQSMYTWVQDMSAIFQCVLSYMDATLQEPLQFIGEVKWTISFDRLDKAKEDTHLPYDLIFIPEWFDTPALFERDAWLKVNHRVRAVEKCSQWLEERAR